MPDNLLILGLGNILMGDEGIGVKAIEYMQDKSFPDHVTLLDGGTGGFHLLSLLREYSRFIIIDATIGEEAPGEIKVLKPRYASDFPRSLTSHDIGLRDLMESAELTGGVPDITLVTINIGESPGVGIGLSPELKRRLPGIHLIVNQILDSFHQQ